MFKNKLTIKSNKMSKITDEQLKQLQEQVNTINQNQLQIGGLETQKHTLIHNAVELQNQLKSLQDELEKEYGKVSINISTGEYEDIKEQDSK
jgi:hypothetical protein